MKKIAVLLALVIVLSIFGVNIVYADAQNSVLMSISMLNQDPNPGRAGDTVKLRFKIENEGGKEIDKLSVELIQDYPYTIVNGDATQMIESISPFQTNNNYYNIEYTVLMDKNAKQGSYPLRLRYKYGDNDWATTNFSVTLSSKEYAQIIYVDKAKLAPGNVTDMSFTITNIGNAALQNLVFDWNEPNSVILPVYSSSTRYVKYLDAGQSVVLDYQVIADVNAKPGLYALKLNLQTESTINTQQQVISTVAGVFVGGDTNFDVTFSESTAGQTSLSVANTGNNPAQSVSVRIPDQANFKVTGSSSSIIGNLDKGDYTLVSFQIVPSSVYAAMGGQGGSGTRGARQATGTTLSADQIAALRQNSGRNNLTVQIDYTDTTGQRQTVLKNVPIQFRSSTLTTGTNGSSRSTGFNIFSTTNIIFAVIIIILIAGYIILRKKPNRDKLMGFFSRKKK